MAKEAKIIVFQIGIGRRTNYNDVILSRNDAEKMLGDLFTGGWQIVATEHARDDQTEECVIIIMEREAPPAEAPISAEATSDVTVETVPAAALQPEPTAAPVPVG